MFIVKKYSMLSVQVKRAAFKLVNPGERINAGFQTSGPRPARLDIRSIVEDMNEQVGRETRHQDATPTPKWLSRELQLRAYEAQVAGRVPKHVVNGDRNIPTLSFNGERDSYLQLLTSRWRNPETPAQLIDFMSVQHESLEKAEDVTDLRHDVNPRAKAGECEAGTLDVDMRHGTTFQAGHNHGDHFSTLSRRTEHGSNRVPPTLGVLNFMKLQHERLGDDERAESDSQQDVHPRVKAGENEDSLDLTLRLGRTREAGHEHGGKISANGTVNRTGTAPWSQHQRVHTSLASAPPRPRRPRRTLNLLRRFAK